MVEVQVKILEKESSGKFLYVKGMEKDQGVRIHQSLQEHFSPSRLQEELPVIQVQLWEVGGERKQYRKLITESYFAYADKGELVSFLEEEHKKGTNLPGS
ncbi:hypothetical protein [Thalassobacillus devorans]|uniref:hypothetical protein n=1 Tax=Thalassobacillus devorans TaxID=279813 RepID=UPI000A1CD5D4|nr:hypothetical protein [Thalassobacillus devorans]